MLTGQILTGQVLTGQMLTGQVLTGPMLTAMLKVEAGLVGFGVLLVPLSLFE